MINVPSILEQQSFSGGLNTPKFSPIHCGNPTVLLAQALVFSRLRLWPSFGGDDRGPAQQIQQPFHLHKTSVPVNHNPPSLDLYTFHSFFFVFLFLHFSQCFAALTCNCKLPYLTTLSTIKPSLCPSVRTPASVTLGSEERPRRFLTRPADQFRQQNVALANVQQVRTDNKRR